MSSDSGYAVLMNIAVNGVSVPLDRFASHALKAAGSAHPYPFDADAFAVGQAHGRRNRYSLTQSIDKPNPAAWIYWYEQGRGTTLGEVA
jgi:hypothetical protein